MKNKICNKVFHEISIAVNRNGKPIFSLCCYMDKGTWFRSDSIENAINSKHAAKIRENAVDNKHKMCDDNCVHWEYVDELSIPKVEIIKSDISISNSCNARCIFCFQSDYKQSLSDSIVNEWRIRLLPNLKWVNLGGGEPLLFALDLIKEISEKYPETRIGIVTNGIMLDKVVPYINKIGAINVSINAGSRDVYRKVMKVDCFNRVVNNIKLIRKSGYGGPVSSTFVICRDNVTDVTHFIDLCKDLGIDHAGFNVDKTDPFFEVSNDVLLQIKNHAYIINQEIKIGIVKETGGVVSKVKKHILYNIRYRQRRK